MELVDFIKKHRIKVLFALLTFVSIGVRISLLKFQSSDYIIYLSQWFDMLKELGGIRAIGHEIGNYNVPYITILSLLTYIPIDSLITIKLVSIVFDYFVAIAAALLVIKFFDDKKKKLMFGTITFIIVILLPTVILNSSFWAQSDSIYTAFVLFSLYFLLDKKHIRSFIFMGIAFAFKLQCVFILPIYALIYLNGFEEKNKIRFWHFLIIPVVNFVLCIPSMLFGRSLMSCMSVYLAQTTLYSGEISMNFPGIYSLLFVTEGTIVFSPGKWATIAGIVITGIVLVGITAIILIKRVKFDKEKILEFGLWSILTTTFLLPHMHERYIYMADILSVVYFIIKRQKKKIYIPILVNIISLNIYINFLFSYNPINIKIVSLIYFALLISLTWDALRKILFIEEDKTDS